jgi:hypothetical protein
LKIRKEESKEVRMMEGKVVVVVAKAKEVMSDAETCICCSCIRKLKIGRQTRFPKNSGRD